MELKELCDLVKETMPNYEVIPHLSFVVALNKNVKGEGFSIEINSVGKIFQVFSSVKITGDVLYEVGKEIESKGNLVQYLNTLNKLGSGDIEETKEELNQTLKKKFDATFRQ